MAYKIGWKKNGVWKYFTVETTSEMLDEVADKVLIGEKVTVTEVANIKLDKQKPFDLKGHTTVYGGFSEDGVYRCYPNYKGREL